MRILKLWGLILSISFCLSGYSGQLKMAQFPVTVSGISSGAFFAHQFHLSFSRWVKGAALFAGGPYNCSQGSGTNAMVFCMNGRDGGGLTIDQHMLYITGDQAKGLIDPVVNLSNSSVYLFAGINDTTVYPGSSVKLYNLYQSLGVRNLRLVNNVPAGHAIPTVGIGNPCASSESPYISNCNYDGVGNAFYQLYGRLNPKATQLTGQFVNVPQNSGRFPLYQFMQQSLADEAVMYVPGSCLQGAPCRLHVAFHGCNQTRGQIENTFIQYAGYNEWADTNQVVILYPQAKVTYPFNPYGCWDWWGYTGEGFRNKSGHQMQTVYDLIQRVLNY